MATLEEVSVRLTQPAKDLADWNYQLGKHLDNYCEAVEEANEINFNQAGLVIQNSADVYGRRIENLCQDVKSKAQLFNEHEAAEESAKSKKKENRSKKTDADFSNFEPIDFRQFVGKNNPMKPRNRANNSVNMLSQRFPQLENVSHYKYPIEIYDVHGELIGKKYDFRCHQILNASGTLVEDLTPQDFVNDYSANSDENDRSQFTDTRTANTIFEDCESDNEDNTEVHETFQGAENCNFSSETQGTDMDVLDSTFTSYADSGIGTSIRSPDISTRPESSMSCDREMGWTSLRSRADSILSDVEKDNTSLNKDSLRLDSPQNASSPIQININSETMNELLQCNNTSVNHNVDENENCHVNVEKNNNESSNDDEIVNSQLRRSKRIKNAKEAVKNLNSKPWEPIPFNNVPDKIPKGRAEFKLPCPIALLKKERPRKKKKVADKKILANFSTNESESARKKIKMYSPTSNLFHSFKEEKIEEYQRISDLHLKNRPTVDVNYLAVNNSSGDLLGMDKVVSATNVSDVNDVENCATAVTDDCTESDDDNFPMPDTPESSGNSEPLKSLNSIQSYHNRIEQSDNEIYDNSDLRTDEEVAVTKWHEHLKPKLQEISRRPPFDLPTYRKRVIQNLKATKDHSLDFNEIMHQRSFGPLEVSRYFFASLQLANTYNVHIDTSKHVEGNNFKLSLLNKELSSDK